MQPNVSNPRLYVPLTWVKKNIVYETYPKGYNYLILLPTQSSHPEERQGGEEWHGIRRTKGSSMPIKSSRL